MAKTDEQPVKSKKKEKQEQLPCFIRYFSLITRVTAIIVVAALWACVFLMAEQHQDDWWDYDFWQWYLIMAAVVVTFIEFILLPMACLCQFVLCRFLFEPLAEGWINTIMYSFLAMPLFPLGYNQVISIVAGILIAALAAVYSLKVMADFSKCCPNCCPCLMVGGEDSEAPRELTPTSSLKESADGAGSYASQSESTLP